MPNVINAIKRIFGRKKEILERDVFFPFSSSPGVYCNDQPNALDTAVRRCSYTLTLSVLNDSGRMNHGAEVDEAFFLKNLSSPPIIFFICNRRVCSVFILYHQTVMVFQCGANQRHKFNSTSSNA